MPDSSARMKANGQDQYCVTSIGAGSSHSAALLTGPGAHLHCPHVDKPVGTCRAECLVAVTLPCARKLNRRMALSALQSGPYDTVDSDV